MASPVIRIRLSCRGRVEYFDFDDRDVVLGRGERADLSIDHPSISQRHARVLMRRGRLILADLGGLVAVGEERLRAATTIADGQTFRIGDVEAAAWVMPEPSLIGRSLGPVTLTHERDAFAIGTRRYDASGDRITSEVTVVDPDAFEPHEIQAWRARMERSASFAPELVASGEIAGRPAIAERIARGIRLSEVIESVESERIAVSRELALAVVRRLAEVLSAHHELGPHGGLIPAAVHLTLDGDVLLLRSGPRPSDPRRDVRWCSPMRRMNLPPSIADDAFALARIAEVLGGGAMLDALNPEARTKAAFREQTAALVALSDRWKVDPSAAHVARVVRLLTDRGRPLAMRSARVER